MIASCLLIAAPAILPAETDALPSVPKFGVFSRIFEAQGKFENAYVDLKATACLTPPNGGELQRIPLYWDGGTRWGLRFSPGAVGVWSWRLESNAPKLNGAHGKFQVLQSQLRGGIEVNRAAPHHFVYQNGEPCWFVGDTQWALFTDNESEKHNRQTVTRYLDRRASQGFNVVHSMLLSEAGWNNAGGPPFFDLSRERLNPDYFREIDERVKLANARGLTCGLVLAWGCKRKTELYAWREFPSTEARKRYARYIVARYSAFNVYFLLSGEWHAELRTRAGWQPDDIKAEFVALGDTVRQADPHHRMIGIHPMTAEGSVREFVRTRWMSFADYQQNYRDLHGRVLLSRRAPLPVVNGEYAYFLRDQNGDGRCDKNNSATPADIRAATWDIAMAGGYVVTGFGSTYFGGNRHPTPFAPDDPKNVPWEVQCQHVKRLFTSLSWWELWPHDELVTSAEPRTGDRRSGGQIVPPMRTYWALADPGKTYVLYVRGLSAPAELDLTAASDRSFAARQFDPRTGQFKPLETVPGGKPYRYQPPNEDDWVVVLTQT